MGLIIPRMRNRCPFTFILHWYCALGKRSVHSVSFMFAIVDIAGFQEKVEKGMKLRVPSIEGDAGAKVTFDKVLLLSKDEKDVSVGAPYVAGAKVTATITRHGKGDKIMVRKFKRRKRYHKTLRGHRQGYTDIEIVSVG